jgi:hypothetical protein
MKELRDAWVRDTPQAPASRGRMLAQGLGCGRLGRRVSEKAGGNELQNRTEKKKSEKNSFVSYIAVEEKAVANDEERYMTKLAGARPNKLEDTRFIFVGNYSPE